MFEDWATYRPQDFLLFSADTYLQLFERQNLTLWPLGHVAALAGAAMIIIALTEHRRNVSRGRLVSLTVVVALISVACGYFWILFQPINFAARYYAIGFGLEALVVLYFGVIKGSLFSGNVSGIPRVLGLGLVTWGLALKPWLDYLGGRHLAGLEFFGIAPDPTAVTLIGLLLATTQTSGMHAAKLLLVLPALWCLISGLTLWGLQLAGSAALFTIVSGTTVYVLVVLAKDLQARSNIIP